MLFYPFALFDYAQILIFACLNVCTPSIRQNATMVGLHSIIGFEGFNMASHVIRCGINPKLIVLHRITIFCGGNYFYES